MPRRAGVEPVDEEAGPAEQDVGHSPHPLEGVVDVRRGGEELMLPDVDLVALLGEWGRCARAVAAERDLPAAASPR